MEASRSAYAFMILSMLAVYPYLEDTTTQGDVVSLSLTFTVSRSSLPERTARMPGITLGPKFGNR